MQEGRSGQRGTHTAQHDRFQPSAEAVRSSDLHAVVTGHSTTSGLNYTVISGTVRNLSKYTCNRTRVSVILKKNGKVVSSDFVLLTTPIPSGKESSFFISHASDIGFDPAETEVVAIPW